MRLDHQFTVPAPVSEAWTVLLDVPRIAPCMPGATLTEFDGETFKGTVKVKLGPVSLTYRGTGRFVETDEAARRVVIEASGKESRGSGTASATVTATLTADGESTRVDVGTDLTITGRPAQFGRGMLADVGERLIGQFADCLEKTLAGPEEEKAAAEGAAAGTAAGTAQAPEGTQGAGAAAAETGVAEPSVGLTSAREDREVQPIDLLEVTGLAETLRKYAPQLATAAGVAVVFYLLGRRSRKG